MTEARDVPLREWVTVLLEREAASRAELEKRLMARMDSAERAVETAAAALTIRLEHSNGLIAQMREQDLEFCRKSELTALERRADLMLEGVDQRLRSLEQARSGSEALMEGRDRGAKPLRDIWMLALGAAIAYATAKALEP